MLPDYRKQSGYGEHKQRGGYIIEICDTETQPTWRAFPLTRAYNSVHNLLFVAASQFPLKN